MNFVTSQSEVAAQLGLDYTQSNIATLIKRWINTSQRMILQAANWPFLRNSVPLMIQTVPDFTTGTVATVLGATTGTFSSAPTTSKTNFFIQTSSSSDWYRIASHTASSTSFTIDSPGWLATATAATLTVRKLFYSTDSTVDRILGIRQSVNPYQLEERTNEQFNTINPNFNQTGSPLIYMMYGKDTSDVWQFKLWPTPDTAINLYIDYLQVVTDLSADADISIIPSKWHTNALLEGAKWLGYNWLDDSRAATSKTSFYEMVEEMKRHELPSTSLHRVLNNIENAAPLRNEFPLPQNYPNV